MRRLVVPGHGPLVALGVLASLAACTPTPTILPTNDLNRPTDIAFMCLGAFGQPGTDADGNPTEVSPFVVSGRPMSVCHPPPVDNAKATQPKASIQNRTFAFVTNSASGDLSVIDADTWKIVDLNKATGGFGRAPLGTLPEQISTTADGCRLMSANRGSCDLSLVDPSTLLAPSFAALYDNSTTGVSVNVPAGNGLQRIAPMKSDGTPLGAAPYEAVFLPQDTSQISMCPIDGAQPATPWRALVTFPGCNLIALIDMPSGNIVSSARAERTTRDNLESVKFVDAGTAPTCSNECGGGRGADGGVDPDAGTSTDSPAPRPTGIAIWPTATRAYVSFANVPAILPIGLSSTMLTGPEPVLGIPLHQGAQGSNRIRLGLDPYSIKTVGQAFPGRMIGDAKDRAYLYVIARDGSLRIIDVFAPGEERECETNFDALNPDGDPNKPDPDASQRCIPYGTVNRRPYSNETAGLRFPTFPVDIAAADMGRVSGDQGDHREDTVAGGYAWVLTANGTIYLVNIDPVQRSIKAVVHDGQDVLFDPDAARVAGYKDNGFVYKNDPTMAGLGVLEPPPFPNRPRDRNFLSYSAALDPALGLVRVDIPPIPVSTGPYIEPLYTQGTENNATAIDTKAKQTFVFFPDRDGAVNQSWDVTWQGTIVPPRYSGVLRGDLLRDGGGGFCTAGVQAGDIVTLNGCTTNTGCPLGMVCQRDATLDVVSGGFTVTGLCVSSNQDSLVDTCAPYLSTLRRYEIVKANNSELLLKPHLDELVRSSLTPCEPDPKKPVPIPADCQMGTGGTGGTGGGTDGMGGTGGMGGSGGAAGAAMMDDGQEDDCFDPLDGSTKQFKCVDYQGQRRCLDPCTKQQECRTGRVCLRSCKGNSDCPSNDCAPDGMCRTGKDCTSEPGSCGDFRYQTCVNGKCEINSYCADGPPLEEASVGCFPQLTPYQVNVNAGFMVTGSQSGSFAAGIETVAVDKNGAKVTDANGDGIKVCAPDPNRDPRLVSRIPVRPAPPALPSSVADVPVASIECDDPKTPVNETFPNLTTNPAMTADDGFFIDHFDPRLAPVIDDTGRAVDPLKVGPYSITQESTQLLSWMKAWTGNVSAPNACIYMGGPVQGDATSTADPKARHCRPQHVRARLRNTQIGFVIANLDRGPPGANTTHFEVHGGFRPQFVVLPSTVEISAPARLVLGPVDSNQEAKVTPGPAPYFFVVDQRRLGRGQGGGPTRGQVVRVNPFGLAANGYLPIYEDYQRSGNLFPIQ